MVEDDCFHTLDPKDRGGVMPRPGYPLTGVVECHHQFGIGVRSDDGVCGTVDLAHMRKQGVTSPDDFWPIGMTLTAVVREVALDGDVRLEVRLDQLPGYLLGH